MKTLECMAKHFDGAHCGLGDWYPEIEKGIQDALVEGENFTTGWYSSKKEIASACLTLIDGKLLVEVSVSDDFDTNGYANDEIVFDTNLELEHIREIIYRVWDQAEEDQRNNRDWMMYSITDESGSWVETFLIDVSGFGLDYPPGDNYHQWGWQEECDLPEDVKEKLIEGMFNGDKEVRCGKYQAMLVD